MLRCPDAKNLEFLEVLADIGIQWVELPPRCPNLNSYAQRFVRTIKESCLEKYAKRCLSIT